MGPLPHELRTTQFTSVRDLILSLVAVTLTLPPVLSTLFPPKEIGAITLIVVVALVLFWSVNRRLPRFKKKGEIGVWVSVSWAGSETKREEVEGILDNLVRQLQNDAATALPASGPNKIVVRRLPRRIQIESRDDAERLVHTTRATFVLWADATVGKHRGERALALGQIKTVVRHRPLADSDHQRSFRADLHEVYEHVPGTLRFENEVEDTKVVADNLAFVSKYQLGLATLVTGFRGVSISLLEASFGDGTYRFQKRARKVVAELRVSYWLMPGRWITPATPSDVVERALVDASAALAADPTAHSAYLLRASCHFSRRDIAGAERDAAQFRNSLPLEFHFYAAVFALHQQKFDTALIHYRRAKKMKFGGSPVIDAIRTTSLAWLGDAVDCLGPEYAFGLGFLNDELQDRIVAVGAYRLCLPLIPSETEAHRFVVSRLAALSP